MKTVEELMEENQRLKKILSHLLPERSGVYFICGESGEHETGMPENIMVCPIYGSEVVQLYKKVGKASAPEW